MFSEEAKRELKELAHSAKFREGCERMRTAWDRNPMSLEQFVQFLTDTNRLFPPAERTQPPMIFTIARL